VVWFQPSAGLGIHGKCTCTRLPGWQQTPPYRICEGDQLSCNYVPITNISRTGQVRPSPYTFASQQYVCRHYRSLPDIGRHGDRLTLHSPSALTGPPPLIHPLPLPFPPVPCCPLLCPAAFIRGMIADRHDRIASYAAQGWAHKPGAGRNETEWGGMGRAGCPSLVWFIAAFEHMWALPLLHSPRTLLRGTAAMNNQDRVSSLGIAVFLHVVSTTISPSPPLPLP
jgi:hypothetical protein